MAQRIALFLSIGITAFVLVALGAAAAAAAAPAVAGSSTIDPAILAQLQTREAQYQALIADANARLQAAVPTEPPAVTPAAEPTAAAYPISPELAADIALRAAPGAYLVKAPELVLYRGTVAYEVTLNTGVVYVDANTGAVLWNGAVRGSGGAGFQGGRDEDEEDDD